MSKNMKFYALFLFSVATNLAINAYPTIDNDWNSREAFIVRTNRLVLYSMKGSPLTSFLTSGNTTQSKINLDAFSIITQKQERSLSKIHSILKDYAPLNKMIQLMKRFSGDSKRASGLLPNGKLQNLIREDLSARDPDENKIELISTGAAKAILRLHYEWHQVQEVVKDVEDSIAPRQFHDNSAFAAGKMEFEEKHASQHFESVAAHRFILCRDKAFKNMLDSPVALCDENDALNALQLMLRDSQESIRAAYLRDRPAFSSLFFKTTTCLTLVQTIQSIGANLCAKIGNYEKGMSQSKELDLWNSRNKVWNLAMTLKYVLESA